MTKIMVVEDDNSLREIYSIRLTAENYEVVSAGDGEEALAVAVKERPDLILSDVMMPKISGFDMLDILRQTPETMNIKVIMMTALSSEDQRQRGEGLGADKYLVKSQVGIEDVINAIHEVLGDKPGANVASASAQAPVQAPATTQVPQIPEAPAVPQAPAMPQAPAIPQVPEIPQAPEAVAAPQAPQMPEVPAMPQTPEVSQAPEVPQAPEAVAMTQAPEVPQAPVLQNTPDASMPTMTPVAPEMPNASATEPAQTNNFVPELDEVAAELSAQQGMINSAEPEEKANLMI